MDWRLELVVVPVADVDRAKDFYTTTLGWDLLVDHRAGEDFRVVQVVPPGSSCAIALMRNEGAAGSLQGLHLAVDDIVAAHRELTERGAAPSPMWHMADGRQQEGAHPGRGSYETFLPFSDPDGNGWLVQEVHR